MNEYVHTSMKVKDSSTSHKLKTWDAYLGSYTNHRFSNTALKAFFIFGKTQSFLLGNIESC